jgi:hypothetical protein
VSFLSSEIKSDGPYLPIASLPYTDRACIDHALGRGAVLLSFFQASFWIGKVYSNMKEINPSVMFRTRREQIDRGKVSSMESHKLYVNSR